MRAHHAPIGDEHNAGVGERRYTCECDGEQTLAISRRATTQERSIGPIAGLCGATGSTLAKTHDLREQTEAASLMILNMDAASRFGARHSSRDQRTNPFR